MTTRKVVIFCQTAASNIAAQSTGLVSQLAAGMLLQSTCRLLLGLANEVVFELTVYARGLEYPVVGHTIGAWMMMIVFTS